MAITEKELQLEKLILKHVSKLVSSEIEKLEDKVIKKDELSEFRKMLWEDSSSFDNEELVSNRVLLGSEESKLIDNEKYYKNLKRIEKKPYFASISFRDLDGDLFNIYISLTFVKDKNYNNILYDWRSPICSLFYDYEIGDAQYTAPGGIIKGVLEHKKQYKIKDNKLLGVFENSINISDELLQEELLKSATDKMQNVVNTIQKEQNTVIRDIYNRYLIVQGIAGSGKTTVALHRIAYLLYQIKDLNSNNIIIFSPNNIFTEYISDVLPSLGEDNTYATTLVDYLSTFLKEFKYVEAYTSFLEKYYTKTTDFKLIEYMQSDEIIKDLDLYLDDFVKNYNILNDLVVSKDKIINKEEINFLIHNRYDRMPLFERIDEIAKKYSERLSKGSLKLYKKIYKLIEDNSSLKKDYIKIYEDFFKSKYSKIIIDNININNNKINYEEALIMAYIKGKLEGFLYNGNIKHVVIDEAQDYNKLLYIIIKEIFKKADFTILGDINQNLNPYYKYKSLKELNSIFTDDFNYVELLKTYRSSPEIVEYSNKILNLKHVNAIREKTNNEVIIKKNISNLLDSLIKDINYFKSKYNTIALITKDYISGEYLYSILKDKIDITLLNISTKEDRKDLVIVPAFISKGLEFDAVIIYNNRDNSFTVKEKNLLYVAVTRARCELIIYN